MLCHNHFNKIAADVWEGKELISWKYASSVSVFNDLTGQDKNTAMSSSRLAVSNNLMEAEHEMKPAAKSNPTRVMPTNLSNDILSTNSFNMLNLLIEATSEKILIPNILPNLPKDAKPRIGRKNDCFLCNFVGLCVWKHMNLGNCWVTKLNFDIKRNPNNLDIFQMHIDTIREKQPAIWYSLTKYGDQNISPQKLCSYCANTRNNIKKGQIWNKNSVHTYGMYNNFRDMLMKISFPLHN